MPKKSGLGDNFYAGAYNLSGDTQMVGTVGGSIGTIDVTGIDKSAHERIGGLRDGVMNWTSFYNTDVGAAHEALSGLPRTDVLCTYCRGTTLGNPAASMVAKQIGYDPTRAADGQLTIAVNAQANGYGLAWGRQLTAGLRTDTAATNGASIDTAASASFGWALAVHVTAFTGTDVTIKVQDSADDAAWLDLAGATTGTVTAVGTRWVVASSTTATVRRYLRAVTTTSAGVTSVTFSVNLVKGEGAALVF